MHAWHPLPTSDMAQVESSEQVPIAGRPARVLTFSPGALGHPYCHCAGFSLRASGPGSFSLQLFV